MSAKNVQIAQFRSRANTPSEPVLSGVMAHIGYVVAILDDDHVSVAIPGRAAPLSARLATQLTTARLQEAIASRRGAVILVEPQPSKRAFLLGLLEPISPARPDPTPEQATPAERSEGQPRVVEADVDGKRVRIVGSDEIVLECGNASITLRRNGRVIIRGTYIETDSAGTNRIKGAAVRIN